MNQSLEYNETNKAIIKRSFPQKIAGVFWNQNEHRLRVLWRLSVVVIIFFIIIIILELATIPFKDVPILRVGQFEPNIAIIIAMLVGKYASNPHKPE